MTSMAFQANIQRSQRGIALVEVMIAGLLMAVAVSLMAGVLLQGSSGSNRLRRKESGALQMAGLLQRLKNYQTADHTLTTLPSAPDTCWDLRNQKGDCVSTVAGNPTPACTRPADNCPWALDRGHHDVSFLLPSELAAYGGRLFYDVTASASGLPQVSAGVHWDEP